jgi:signal transduction histidine kinase/streptogramin lyase
LSTTNGLSENIVLSLHLDREGSLWVGTDGGGLDRVRPELFRVLEGSEGRVVKSVAEDKDGGLWVGYNFDRIDYWAGDTGRRYSAPQGLVNAQVRCIFVDSAQGVWAGTYGRGLLHLQNGAFVPAPGTGFIPPDRDVTAIFEDRMKRIWVGTQNGLATWDGQRWTAHSVRDGMSANFVRAIAEDLNGNLWIGTEGGGLNRLREGRFTAFTHADGLPSDSVGALYVDKQGVLWIGTSRGLARYGGGQWTSYAASLGPGAASVGYILEDDFGYLWLGSNGGLRRVRKADLNGLAAGTTNPVAVRTYGKPDGMPTRECTQGSQPAACRTRDGRLWFPTIKGLVSVEPALLNRNTNPPPVIIESVSIDGQMKHSAGLRTPALQELAIPAGSESLEIAYTSLNLAAPDKGRFRYRLEGHETGWMAAPSFIRKVRYSKLPPDRYRFVVQACNEDGVWSETGASLAVVVLPPFWRTWWFMSAAAVALLGLVTASVHYISTQKLQKQVEKLRQQEALEQERARIARDIHDQVGASLTQVSLLGEMIESDRNDPEEVAQHARQITQTAVDTTRALDEIVWTVNPSNDTLDGLITYICKYAQDYLAVAGLRYRLDVPPELPSTPVTPELRHNVFLAAKEAITNVVKHARASAVAVRLRVEPGRFSVEIEDDGRGLGGLDPEAAAKRNGLRNMRKRMEDVGGAFAIGPAPERGTVIRLVAPVRNE